MQEVQEDDGLGSAAPLAYYVLCAVFPILLFGTALLGFLPLPNLMERLLAGLAIVLPGEAVTLLQDNIRQLVTELARGTALLRDAGGALVLLQCRGGDHGGPEPGV